MAKGSALSRHLLTIEFAVLLLALWTAPLLAATTTYTGVYAGGTIPAGNTLVLNNGATVTGNVVANGTLQFNQTGSLTLSSILSGTGELSLTNTGTLNLTGTTTTSNAVVLDMMTAVSAGVLQARTGTGNIYIGKSGTAAIRIGGGVVRNATGYIGDSPNSLGVAAISSGLWVNNGSLRIGGFDGRGTLDISGGAVTNRDGFVGGRTSQATISSGSWTNSGDLYVTSYVGNTLNISGGCVSSTTAYLGWGMDNKGSAIVSGGTWATAGTLYLGYNFGTGRLNLTGGSVTASNAVIGIGTIQAGFNSGAAVISGGTLTTTALVVGRGGTGDLAISGGKVTSAYTTIGGSRNSSAVATISSDADASFGDLDVGRLGVGVLNLVGGRVTSQKSGIFGTAAISSGTWINRGGLEVGGTLGLSGGVLMVGGTLSRPYGSINLSPGGMLQIGTGGTTGVLATDLTNNGTLVFDRSDASTYSGILSGSGSISKRGDGSLIFVGPNTLTGPTTIQQGSLQLAHAASTSASTISPLAGGVLSLTPGLQATVGGLNPNSGGLVDVGTGMVTVANGLSQLSLVAALQSGRAGGSWAGSSGITSSAAASSTAQSMSRSVGWLDNGNGSVTFAYAAPGDTNLDWTVDILDASNFLSFGKFDAGLAATWIEGDFNYDNVVDILDAADFFATSLYDAGSYNSPAGSIAAVPEPSILGLVGVGVVGLLVARRKRPI
jgi:fibronectin-binding autotransporter adhesin